MTKMGNTFMSVLYRICGERCVVLTCILIFASSIDLSLQDRGPPMVAPNHYDNAQNPNFQHPPPAGVPPGAAQGFGGQPQQAQYAQGYQQPPAHAPHHGQGHHDQKGSGHHEQKLLHGTDMQHEREHIAEHMDVPIDTSKMSEEELQFHYFKMHDNDNNNMLDGTELIKSLIHWHETGHDSPQNQQAQAQQEPQYKLFNDEELIALIDPILKMDDANLDGYIDYPEFIRAQKKSAASGAAH